MEGERVTIGSTSLILFFCGFKTVGLGYSFDVKARAVGRAAPPPLPPPPPKI